MHFALGFQCLDDTVQVLHKRLWEIGICVFEHLFEFGEGSFSLVVEMDNEFSCAYELDALVKRCMRSIALTQHLLV